MNGSNRRKIRRRDRIRRGFRKTFINIVFAPARIPKITRDMVDVLMRACEVAAMTFVIVLIAHITSPDHIHVGVVIVTGGIFAALISLIKLSEYQEKIEQYRYYGFRL